MLSFEVSTFETMHSLIDRLPVFLLYKPIFPRTIIPTNILSNFHSPTKEGGGSLKKNLK